jgi:hypothetical protein
MRKINTLKFREGFLFESRVSSSCRLPFLGLVSKGRCDEAFEGRPYPSSLMFWLWDQEMKLYVVVL